MKVTLANKTIRDTTEITISLPERDSKISEFAEKLYIPEISADKNCVVLQCRKFPFIEGMEVNIDELNYLAKRIDGFDFYEAETFYTAAEMEKPDTVEDLINLSFQIDNYFLIDLNDKDTKKLNRVFLLKKYGSMPVSELDTAGTEEINEFFNSRKKGYVGEYGIIFKFKEEAQRLYDGLHFPPYYYGKSSGLLLEGTNENGQLKMEFIEIPCDNIAIDKALYHMGLDKITRPQISIDNCGEEHIYNKIQRITEELSMSIKEKLYTMNLYSKAIETMPDMGMLSRHKTIETVLDICNPQNTEELTLILNGADEFKLYEGVNNYRKYALNILNSPEYHFPDDIKAFIRLDAYARHCLSHKCHLFTENGLVVYSGSDENIMNMIGRNNLLGNEIKSGLAEDEGDLYEKPENDVGSQDMDMFF